MIENEIKYEKKNIPENTELLELLEMKKWTITSKGMFHKLTKQVDDKIVNITFLSRSPAPSNEKNEEEDEDEDQQDNVHDFYEFTVYVRKGNNPQALYADFIVTDGIVNHS